MSYPSGTQRNSEGLSSSTPYSDVKLEGFCITSSSETSRDPARPSIVHNLPDPDMFSDQKSQVVKPEIPQELSEKTICMSFGKETVRNVLNENKSLATFNELSNIGAQLSESNTNAVQLMFPSSQVTWRGLVCKEDSEQKNPFCSLPSFMQEWVQVVTSSANEIRLKTTSCDSSACIGFVSDLTSGDQKIQNMSRKCLVMKDSLGEELCQRQVPSQQMSNDDSVRGNSVNKSLPLLSPSIVNGQHLTVNNVPTSAPIPDQESAPTFLYKSGKYNINKSWKCHICTRVLPSQNSYEYHRMLHTSGKRRFKCDKCDKSFSAKRSLDDHALSHSTDGSNSLKCQLCDKVLSSLNALKNHQMIHTGEKPFKCGKCDKAYICNKELQNHMKSHADGWKRYQCELCDMSYTLESGLRRHVRAHHSDHPRPMYRCSHCPKGYVQRTSLHQHIKRHEGVEDLYKCEDCSKVFRNKSTFFNHMQSKHNPENLYKCQECDKWFPKRYMLNSHVKLVHCEQPRQRRYKCEDCSKMFYNMNALKEHMNVHLNVKPFTCDVCGKSFAREANLQQHVVIHSGLKPFKCNLCDRAFSWRSHLNSHLRGHQGLKLHQCEQCGKSFSERSGLRLHMRAYHQTELPYTNNQLQN